MIHQNLLCENLVRIAGNLMLQKLRFIRVYL